jgi:hypothetical protein
LWPKLFQRCSGDNLFTVTDKKYFPFDFFVKNYSPPPEEVYTLHRKLAGAYMLCIKLGAVVRSRDMLENVVANHKFDDGMPNPITGV